MFVVCAEVDSIRWKILQIHFQARDGSIFVNFPYFLQTTGLISRATLPGGPASSTLRLEIGGKVSSHLVKYSHHPSGTVLFSQDGRVVSSIRKQGVPLARVDGHLFTVHAEGLNQFRSPGPKDDRDRLPNPKRTTLTFIFKDRSPDSLKFVGRLFSFAALDRAVPNRVVRPRMDTLSADGKAGQAFVCSAPAGMPSDDLFLLLSCEAMPRLDQGRKSSLLFLGGFDEYEVATDSSKETSVLAFSYPVMNSEELRGRIGSVDFNPKPQAQR